MPDVWLPSYLRLDAALAQFIAVRETQGQRHIKPLHQHIAIRLVIEGGFHPEEITPHPPLLVETRGCRNRLVFDQRAQRENEQTVLGGLKTKDIDVNGEGEVVQAIQRYHDVLLGLAGRRFVRDDFTRYEAVCLALVNSDQATAGSVFQPFPPADSPLSLRAFFDTIYRTYDLRFPYLAASISSLKRLEWDEASPALTCLGSEPEMRSRLGYTPRLG
ncbi:MAG: hypothetical protein ABSH34_07795 [Verrucomicrobiota bacterium]|jgi:hypothetical protein